MCCEKGLHAFQFQQSGTFHPRADCLRLCQRHFQHCAGTDTAGQRGQTGAVVVVVVAVVVGAVAVVVGVVAVVVGVVVQVVAQSVYNRCRQLFVRQTRLQQRLQLNVQQCDAANVKFMLAFPRNRVFGGARRGVQRWRRW